MEIASHICTIPQKDQSQLRLLMVVNKAQIYPVNTRCRTHHTPTYITQSIKFRASQSPPLKSLMSSLGPTLWCNVFEPTRDYWAGSNTICNDPRKSASHIYAIPQKDQSQLRLIVIVNKAQIYLINTRCETHHTPTHITQSIKLGYHNLPHLNPYCPRQDPLCGVVSLSPHGIIGLALIPYVTTQEKALSISALYLKRTSHN